MTDTVSIASLVDFINNWFGKLDILINSATVTGSVVDFQDLDSSTKENMDQHGVFALYKLIAASADDYEKAEECLDITYYSTKKPIDYLMLLQLSNSLRIMNISSILGKVQIQTKGMIEISPYRRMIRDTIDEKISKSLSFANDGIDH